MRTKLRTKILAAAGAVVLALGIATLSAGSANAHVPDATATCSTLTVSLTYYIANKTNTVAVKIDGKQVDSNSNFGDTFVTSYTFSDKTAAHTWQVDYTAGDDPKGTYGYSGSKSGTSVPCVVTDATAAITFSTPTCNAAQTLVLGATENATWGAVTYSGADNLDFMVTATAVGNHRFVKGDPGSDGSTKSFSGTLLVATGACPAPPCLANSAVSYTYDATTNSGVIEVSGTKGQTLCNPFWVTAASWTYDGNTMWPQTLDKWAAANGGNMIDAVGTYPYGAEVGCGQGDIYATFIAPGVPYPTAKILTKSRVPYAEHFLHEMGFSGPTPTYMNRDAATCHVIVVVTTPSVVFTDQCGIAHDTIVGNTDTKEIDFTTKDDRVNGAGLVTVTAAPVAGSVFPKGTVTSWSFQFTNTPCVVVVPTPPTATAQQCLPEQNGSGFTRTTGGVTVGVDTNLEYTIIGVGKTVYASTVVTAGFTELAPGDYTVSVKALNGMALAPDATAQWPVSVSPALCAISIGDPYAVHESCSVFDADTTVPGHLWVDLGGNLPNELEYRIVGPGVNYVATKEVNTLAAGDYLVTATAKAGYTLGSEQSEWPFTIKAAKGCSLVTHGLISTTATATKATCASSGTFTLANTTGVVWYQDIDGVKTQENPGTYKVNSGSTVKIHAELLDANYGWEDDAQTEWTFTYASSADCLATLALPTLAFTGSAGGPSGLLLAGGLLLIGGAVIAFERRFRASAK